MDIKRPVWVNAVRQADEAWQGYELRWPRFDYTIAEKPTGHLAVRWRHRPHRWVPGLKRDQHGKIQRIAREKRVPWPEGGLFVPTELLVLPKNSHAVEINEPNPRDWYNPIVVAGEIILDVQRIPPTNPVALLRFVNKWGHLGVGIPGQEGFGYDGVLVTGKYLQKITWWIETYQALQNKMEVDSSFGELASFLNGVLGEIHPGVNPTKKGLNPIYRVSRFIDALWLECWETATSGKKLNRCPDCRALFLPGRANQMYCTRRCAIRPTVRKAKAKKRERERKMRLKGKAGF